MTILVLLCLLFALVPARLFGKNLGLYTPPPPCSPTATRPACSVLIPARNEQAAIGPAVAAALASEGVDLEIIVLDDASEDQTAEVVSGLARADDRVRLAQAPKLPPGWCGKQHACWVLSGMARHPTLVFLDADVRITPDALARMAAFLDASGADLASGIPRQVTVGLLETLLIPLIHFILLGFLPLGRMRRSRRPEYAAGCGQLFIASRGGYDRSGGHAAIRASLHDGITLPRAFRTAGLRTDLFDATEMASCRMYRSAREVWHGLAKNAGEALAAPALIAPMTVVLLLGQVLPLILLTLGLAGWPRPWSPWQLALAGLATASAFLPSPGRRPPVPPILAGARCCTQSDPAPADDPVVRLPPQRPGPSLDLERPSLPRPGGQGGGDGPSRAGADGLTGNRPKRARNDRLEGKAGSRSISVDCC